MLRMQRRLAPKHPSEPAQDKTVASKRKEKSNDGFDESELSDEPESLPDEERRPKNKKRRQQVLSEADLNFKDIDPATRARIEAFVRFAVPYNRH